MSRRTGAVGVIYLNDTPYAAETWSDSGWNPIENARDVTAGGEIGKADVSARNNIRRQYVPTLLDETIELSMPWDPEDAQIDALREARESRSIVAIAALDDSIANNGQGPTGNYYVTKFERSEPLEEGMMLSVELSPASFNFWKEAES